MKAYKLLTARADALRSELREITRKLVAMRAFVGFCNPDTTACDRIEALLHENPDIEFSPAEIMEAVHASEEAVRKALQRLQDAGYIKRSRHARYRAALP